MNPRMGGQGTQGAVLAGTAPAWEEEGLLNGTHHPRPPLCQLPPAVPLSWGHWSWAAPPQERKACRGQPWLVSLHWTQRSSLQQPGAWPELVVQHSDSDSGKGLEGTHR